MWAPGTRLSSSARVMSISKEPARPVYPGDKGSGSAHGALLNSGMGYAGDSIFEKKVMTLEKGRL